jgi:cob(I)alamin adenosyltransferase
MEYNNYIGEKPMKIYTKTGDTGMTGLYGGGRVSKSAPRISAYGDIDELNALLGLAAAQSDQDPVKKTLKEIQSTLFVVGAQLASPKADPKIERITNAQIEFLERQIDVITETLPPLKTFILPGGGVTASTLHLARTVCRRAERSIVYLTTVEGEDVDRWLITYVNRLSDFLFTLARLANQLEKIADIPWVPSKTK